MVTWNQRRSRVGAADRRAEVYMHGSALLLMLVLTGTPHYVVLDDGSSLQLREPPRVEHGLLIGTLLDGTVISLPEERVDPVRTETANQAVIPCSSIMGGGFF